MPRFLFPRFYQLTYRSARLTFRTQTYQQQLVRARTGTAWYRYVGYRNNTPQAEWAGRTQFLTLASDLNNRWTGASPDGRGSQGLYLSQDFVNEGNPFPELTHYQDGPDEGGVDVPYYEYHPGVNPVIQPKMRVAQARNLRSMFLFTLLDEQPGLDLRLRLANQTNPLLEAIQRAMTQDPEFQSIRDETRGVVDITDLDSIYQHADSADFCRALGNAALEISDIQHLVVTSVRDGVSVNIVARTPVRADGAPPVRLEYLQPQGRSTFFADVNGKRGVGVFSVQDLIYNATFESPTNPPPQLPEVSVVKEALVAVQETAVDELGSRLVEELSTRPANSRMDNVAEKLANVQEKLTGDAYGETVTAINQLKTAVESAAQDQATVDQFKASLELSSGVADTMSSMADAVQAAQERIDGRDPAPPDQIDDPNPDELEPSRVDPVDPAHGRG
jgi:hypothetical protein